MTGLNPYEFRFTDSGVVLNTDVAANFVDVTEVQGLDAAPVRQNLRAKEGLDGDFIQAEFEEHRVVVLSGTVYGDEAYLDQLKQNYAPGKKAQPFNFCDELGRERQLFARALGFNYAWSTMRRLGMTDFQVTLLAGDPAIYSDNLKSITASLPGNLSGRGYPKSFPYGYGGFAGSPLTGCFNDGTRPTWPVIRFYGDCTNPKIENETTGEFVRLLRDIGPLHYVEIDMMQRQVLLDGDQSVREDMSEDSYWFNFEPGENVIRYSAQVIGGSQCTIEFRDAWR